MTYKKNKNYNNKLMREGDNSGNKTLPNIRLSTELYNQFIKAVENFNKRNKIQIDLTFAHRLALAFWSEQVLFGKFSVTFDTK